VHDQCMYDYAIIRVVPRVEREEFINVGVIISCPARKYLQASIEIDQDHVLSIDSNLDLQKLREHLAAIQSICQGGKKAGEIGKLTQRERFNWLISPRSTIIQTSAMHTGWCKDPAEQMEHLMNSMVRKKNN
jgi:hypothetical protein